MVKEEEPQEDESKEDEERYRTRFLKARYTLGILPRPESTRFWLLLGPVQVELGRVELEGGYRLGESSVYTRPRHPTIVGYTVSHPNIDGTWHATYVSKPHAERHATHTTRRALTGWRNQNVADNHRKTGYTGGKCLYHDPRLGPIFGQNIWHGQIAHVSTQLKPTCPDIRRGEVYTSKFVADVKPLLSRPESRRVGSWQNAQCIPGLTL